MIVSAQKEADSAKIDQLLDICFGLGRHQKSSYSLRRGVAPIKGLGFVFRGQDEIFGSIQFWPTFLQNILTGDMQKVLLLGPLAVSPLLQGQGVGVALMKRGLSTARYYGYSRVMLVGDLSYYSQFGFQPTKPADITMPGGVDADRLLYLDLQPSAPLPELGAMVPYAPLDQKREACGGRKRKNQPFVPLVS